MAKKFPTADIIEAYYRRPEELVSANNKVIKGKKGAIAVIAYVTGAEQDFYKDPEKLREALRVANDAIWHQIYDAYPPKEIHATGEERETDINLIKGRISTDFTLRIQFPLKTFEEIKGESYYRKRPEREEDHGGKFSARAIVELLKKDDSELFNDRDKEFKEVLDIINHVTGIPKEGNYFIIRSRDGDSYQNPPYDRGTLSERETFDAALEKARKVVIEDLEIMPDNPAGQLTIGRVGNLKIRNLEGIEIRGAVEIAQAEVAGVGATRGGKKAIGTAARAS